MIRRSTLFLTIFLGFIFANIDVASVYATTTNPISNTVTVTATVLHDNFDHEGNGGSGPTGIKTVVFKGLTSPRSKVTLIKNGTILTTIGSQIDGKFEIHLSYLNPGYYNFSVKVEDDKHLESTLNLHTIYIASGITTLIEGIFIPPTITTDKIEIRKGDSFFISGSSVPNSEITLSILYILKDKNKEDLKKIAVSSNGDWSIKLDSKDFKNGEYQIKAKASIINGVQSVYSNPITFVIGKKNIKRMPDVDYINYDLNHDGHVNLSDFSILVFWYKRAGFPSKFDFNHDGRIDLIDFSMMIFHWTG